MAEAQAAVAPVSEHTAALNLINAWTEPEKKAETPAPAPVETPAPETPAAPDKEAPPAETPPGETPAEIRAEEIRRHKLKYQGEEFEVDENELKSGYLKGKDYTVKTQALAKDREEFDTRFRATVEPVVKQYQENLKVIEGALWKTLAPQLQNVDWNRLAREDPGEWARQQQAMNNVTSVINAVRQEQVRLDTEAKGREQATKQKEVAEAVATLQRDIPGWDEPIYQKSMAAGVKLGMNPEKVSQITDPSVIKALHFAGKYLELQDAKSTTDKRVADVPKVVKPGTAEKPDAQAEKWKSSMTRLRKSGRDEDALEVAKLFV